MRKPFEIILGVMVALPAWAGDYAVLKRGEVEAVIVNNAAVDDATLPGHRAGYSGVASLKHTKRAASLFVPTIAGLNFEHIHDGTKQDNDVLYEPRRAPMELRVVNEHAVELHQPPTPNWKLESTTRYTLLADGTIEMKFECVPRAESFRNGYIGLFWASYINQPESLDIHFRGHGDGDATPRWIRGVTPEHGKLATHVATNDTREFRHDADFPMTLVFGFSNHRYDAPWYYGVSHGMAFAQMFRARDQIRFAQSPSGGGKGNPAWDFQFFIPNYKVGQRYSFTMRAAYVPFESMEQVEKATATSRAALR